MFENFVLAVRNHDLSLIVEEWTQRCQLYFILPLFHFSAQLKMSNMKSRHLIYRGNNLKVCNQNFAALFCNGLHLGFNRVDLIVMACIGSSVNLKSSGEVISRLSYTILICMILGGEEGGGGELICR